MQRIARTHPILSQMSPASEATNLISDPFFFFPTFYIMKEAMRRKKTCRHVYLYELKEWSLPFNRLPWQAAEGDSHGLVHKSQVALMKQGSQFDLDLDAINNMRFCNHRQMLNESFRASGIIAVLRRRTLKRMFLQSQDMLHVVFSWLHIFEPFDIKVSCVQSFWKLQWQSPWKRWKQRSGSWNHSRQRKRLHGKQQLGSITQAL